MLRLILVASLVGSAPAVAQSSDTTKAKDPFRKICERVEVTGSRLGVKRVCMTAQQWEEQRHIDRHSIEDLQQRQSVRSAP